MSKTLPMLELKQAELLLHKPDTYLMQMNTIHGPEWFVVPGGRVAAADARRILARPDMAQRDSGLFPNVPQSWKIVREEAVAAAEAAEPEV